jgi:hypothetical protein
MGSKEYTYMSVRGASFGITPSRSWRPGLAKVSDKELVALQNEFDTHSRIRAID